MVALTGDSVSRRPARSTCGASTSCAGSRSDGDELTHRRADDVLGHPGARRCAASTCPAWSKPPRRSARPRSRTAGHSAATSPMPRRPATRCRSCSRWTRRSCSARSVASERSRPRTSGPATARRPSPRTNSSSGSGSRSPLAGKSATARSGPAGPRRSARSSWRSAWRDDPAIEGWTGVRVALGSVAATPIRAIATEDAIEGRSPDPGDGRSCRRDPGVEIHPIDDVRSTAEYRRIVAARILHRLMREAGGW